MVQQDDVDNLIAQVADEHSLELTKLLPEIAASLKEKSIKQKEQQLVNNKQLERL